MEAFTFLPLRTKRMKTRSKMKRRKGGEKKNCERREKKKGRKERKKRMKKMARPDNLRNISGTRHAKRLNIAIIGGRILSALPSHRALKSSRQ
jgi:hypothetical protein